MNEIITVRLKENLDIKKACEKLCEKHNINAGIILSSVGSVKEINIRKADGISELHKVDNFEIISINGTLSKNRIHLHVSYVDNDMNIYAGHLLNNNIVNTTLELAILKLNDRVFKSAYDNNTGYKELIIENGENND